MNFARFRDAFAEALDTELFTIDYLDWLMASGRGLFWSTDEAAIIAEIRTYPTGAKVIHGLSACGSLEDITDTLIPAAEAWGKSQGCSLAIIESRPGWARALKASGYSPHQIAVRKPL